MLDNLVQTPVDAQNSIGFKHPNVLDVKLGQQLYDDDASTEKVARMTQTAVQTTSALFGIRLTGGKVRLPKSELSTFDKCKDLLN